MKTSDEIVLSIELDEERLVFHPGDQLSGNLQLQLTKDVTIGKVCLRLVGRTKLKIAQSNGQSTPIFRGRVELFSEEIIVHDDHFTHKSGAYKFPFKFRFPDVVDPSKVTSVWKVREGFVSNTDNRQPHPLPPSFWFAESRAGKRWQALITYAVEAIITEPQKSKGLQARTRYTAKTIRVAPCPTPDAIDMDDPRQRNGFSRTFTIRSLRLLPEYASHMSFTQRAISRLNRAHLPRFSFDIDISYHSVLQAYHPAPLPFIIAASPRADIESTTIQPSMQTFYRYPTILIKHVKLMLQAHTECRCPSILSDAHAGKIHDIKLVDRHFQDMRLIIRSVAWDQKNHRDGDAPTSIDLGKECSIFITQDPYGSYQNVDANRLESSSQIWTSVKPTFASYNISRRYFLAWNIEIECAGERMALNGRSPEEVVILGPPVHMNGESVPGRIFRIGPSSQGSDSDTDEHSRRSSNRDTLPAYSEMSHLASTAVGSPLRRKGELQNPG